MNKKLVVAILALVVVAASLVVVMSHNNQGTTNQNQQTTNNTSANYSGQGLSQFPKQVLNDTSITTLDVSNNQLTGALPAEIKNLVNLETLRLVLLIATVSNITPTP